MESIKNSQNHKMVGSPRDLIHATIKEGGTISSQQMTRQQNGTKPQKPYKMQAWKISKKVAWWVVDKFHNIFEHDNKETSTSTFMSPSKDQHSNGLHVIKLFEVESVEKDGQPNMYTNLEKPKLKHAQATTPNCNMAFVVKM